MSEIVRLLQRRADAARRDTEFAVAVRHLAHPIRLAVEPSGPVVTAWEGDGRSPGEDAVVVRAAEAIWQRIACAVPAPGYHSFTAVRRQAGAVAVDGSPLAVAQALHALERLFEILRRDEEDAATSPPDLSTVSGAYHRVTVDGEPLNLYAESCGPADAPALLMLHTAGADSRQYHGLMADARLLGQTSYIYEAGCAVMIDGERTLLTGSWQPNEKGTPAEQLLAAGVADALFERFAGRLEWHEPWHHGREFSLLMRGKVDVDEANALIRELGYDDDAIDTLSRTGIVLTSTSE